MPFWKELNGTDGKVSVPSVGAVLGIMNRWSIVRSEESDSGNPSLLTLRASFSWSHPGFMSFEDLRKEVVVQIRRDKYLRVTGKRMAFDGQTLLMEGVELWPVE